MTDGIPHVIRSMNTEGDRGGSYMATVGDYTYYNQQWDPRRSKTSEDWRAVGRCRAK